MTRKDYVKIAQVFKSYIEIAEDGDRDVDVETVKFLASDMAYMLKRDNAAFDREKFLSACEVKF